ncbi:Kef-type K+ transport system membrane component KefB/nucleotide-binding universal stress UspA family protein [Lewinella marina]|uniref:Sodium:proton antiporter n=1 Tax=Neolewinella marina TaxID=438751 RepID=A0A2G0CB26_9BACT|nr:cation:proton antiporter [Neolewinella marina]NJB86824.1 Kef-type K+ transport system membrane component KefB/nucleotide-binding universal stress UspA family protein [Neolewinella marina]PHK97166.1 sodium:proton antiporter [Neolewinella marina]
MPLPYLFDVALPLTNPVVKFLLILVIILIAPLLLNKLKIPHLLGLIIAGAVVGPNGFNLIERDSSIILSGTAGLLYIMFLAGLEIDLVDFKKNSGKSLVFGLYTFIIPMTLGTLTGLYVLKFSGLTSVLLASMFASHTLIAYPLVSKLGVAKNKAVNVTVGGTMITDTLALLVLAVVVGMTSGEVNAQFWVRLTLSILAFGLTVMLLFPIIGRWFLRRFDDNVSQYIFVLVMVFLGAALAELAGIEAIIGAFLSGLALNRLIPHTSPLMNRIEFVGNAIFIPFFLIGVGMLIDYRAFFSDLDTLWVGTVMIVVATSAKFLAAWLTQQTYGFSLDERRLIFGLSNAQAAATLAAVLVGYNIILGETAAGAPIRLLDETVLNGTILMILFTCTMASFVAQKGAKNIALAEAGDAVGEEEEHQERILIPISNVETTDELINLGITVKSRNNKDGLYALSIVDNTAAGNSGNTKAKKILHKAAVTASATDTPLHELLRYDLNIANGIISVVKEQRISDLILGLHVKKDISDTFLGNLTEGILTKCNTTTLIYKPYQPFATVQRHVVIIPADAEKEIGFPFWLVKVWNIARNSGAKLVFYGPADTLEYLRGVQAKHPVHAEFNAFDDWDDFLVLTREIQKNDNLIIVMSRREHPSFQSSMVKVPYYLNKYFADKSFILVYPIQIGVTDDAGIDFRNPTMLEPFEKLDEIGKTIASLFRRK